MAQGKKVYVAHSAFVAFIDRAHPKHAQASAFFRYFAQEKYIVFSSYLSIEEAYRIIYEKISPTLAKDFVKALLLGNINILYPSEPDFKQTIKTLTNYKNTELTLKEAQSAVLADRNGISQIATFDYLHRLFGQTAFYLPV